MGDQEDTLQWLFEILKEANGQSAMVEAMLAVSPSRQMLGKNDVLCWLLETVQPERVNSSWRFSIAP